MAFTLPDIPTEDRLLRRANLHDQAAITEIYECYFPAVYQFVRLHVEEASLAEDIASEVFFKLIDTVGGRSGPQHSLRGWLFRVARHEIYKHHNQGRREQVTALDEQIPMPPDMNPEVQLVQSMEVIQVQQALRVLSDEHREVLILRFLEGFDLEETAQVMGKSISAIKSLQFRALSSLSKILSGIRVSNCG